MIKSITVACVDSTAQNFCYASVTAGHVWIEHQFVQARDERNSTRQQLLRVRQRSNHDRKEQVALLRANEKFPKRRSKAQGCTALLVAAASAAYDLV